MCFHDRANVHVLSSETALCLCFTFRSRVGYLFYQIALQECGSNVTELDNFFCTTQS
jgi:hypothetical protein